MVQKVMAAGINRGWIGRSAKIVATIGISLGLLATPLRVAEAGTPLRIQYYPDVLLNLPIWVAQERNFFAAHGIDAKLFELNSAPVAVSALAGNSVDIIQFPVNYGVIYNNKNPQQRVTQVTGFFAAAYYSVLGSNELIASCPDAKKAFPGPVSCLKGKKVGISTLGSESHQFLRSLLSRVGMTDKDVTLVPTGGAVGALNMLRTGQTEYSLMVEPGTTTALELKTFGRLVDLSDDTLLNPWTGQASYTLTATVEREPAKFRAFARAIDDAVKFIRDPGNANEVQRIFLKYAHMEPELASVMLRRNLSNFVAGNDCAAIANQSKWLVSTGQLPAGSEPKCEDFTLSGSN